MSKPEEFHQLRKPFFIHPDTFLVKFPTAKHMNSSCAKWFSEEGIPFLHTLRGYFNERDNYVMLYVNDFEIPDVVVKFMCYLFEYFPTIEWVGLGCHKGKPGEIWKPKLKVFRDEQDTRNSECSVEEAE